MKKKIYDENMPVGKLTPIPDYLPRPEDLATPDDTVKVTMFLSKESVNYFKKEAALHHTKYQRMIRNLLDYYVSRTRAA